MILLDANLLLYAYNPRAERHAAARAWLEDRLSDGAPVGLCWQSILAFLRISTNPRVFERPLLIGEARAIVASWLAVPSVTVLAPEGRYWEILAGLLEPAQVSGPLVIDVALAALALEHGAVLCTTDRDFSRFDTLETLNPLQAS